MPNKNPAIKLDDNQIIYYNRENNVKTITMPYIEILTTDGDRQYTYNPSEDTIDSLLIIDALNDLGISDDDVAVVSISDLPDNVDYIEG